MTHELQPLTSSNAVMGHLPLFKLQGIARHFRPANPLIWTVVGGNGWLERGGQEHDRGRLLHLTADRWIGRGKYRPCSLRICDAKARHDPEECHWPRGSQRDASRVDFRACWTAARYRESRVSVSRETSAESLRGTWGSGLARGGSRTQQDVKMAHHPHCK